VICRTHGDLESKIVPKLAIDYLIVVVPLRAAQPRLEDCINMIVLKPSGFDSKLRSGKMEETNGWSASFGNCQ